MIVLLVGTGLLLTVITDWMELLRRKRNRLLARTEGGAAVQDRVAGVHLSRRRRVAASGLGRGRHAERVDGDPKPDCGAGLHRPVAAADARVFLQRPKVRYTADRP